MLDLSICYLFIAALDSFLDKNYLLSAIELSFFIWSKPFFPFLFVLLIGMVVFIYGICRKIGINKLVWGFEDNAAPILHGVSLKKIAVYLLIVSIFIAGPFVCKSVYYAGTPLYPFFPGIVNLPHIDKISNHWQSIISSSKSFISIKDSYGTGRSISDFLKHLWVLAVPEKGVNNRFDYPLGLPYLLFLVPFLCFTTRALRLKKFPLLAFFAIIYWSAWWFGSQQSRFLYIPLLLIFITTSAHIRPEKIFLSALLLSLFLNGASIFRAHHNEFSLKAMQVLRAEDIEILKMSVEYHKQGRRDIVTINRIEATYADFPVKVVGSGSDAAFWLLTY